jgi:hypothetical protein
MDFVCQADIRILNNVHRFEHTAEEHTVALA